MSEAAPLRRTPLYDVHKKWGARLVPFAGWEMPVQYSGIQEEHRAVRERAGLFDVSHMGQIHFRGRGATAALAKLVTCPVANLKTHRARYGLMLNERGGCIDDVMLTREADSGDENDALFLCVNASNVQRVDRWCRQQLADEIASGLVVENRSDETALLALQGPAARSVLAKLLSGPVAVGTDAPLPKRFRCAPLELAGQPVFVSGTGYTGGPGFELYLPADGAPQLFEAILEAGRDDGVVPVGLGARDTLRLEAGLALYGNELDDTTTPIEAGLDRFVRLEKGGFIGAEALAAPGAHPRRLVGLEMVERGIARADYPIEKDGEEVGRVTSGAPSPSLGKSIALGYVPEALGKLGQSLSVRIRKKSIKAKVVPVPFA